MATATLTGFPPVVRVRVYQSSSGLPGKAVVDTLVNQPATPNWPDITTLTMTHDGVTLTWEDMRVCKAPRVRRGYMRTVLEDSRWKLRQFELGTNYNHRDGTGRSYAATQKTVSELCGILATSSGLTIIAGLSMPPWHVPAPWRGRTGSSALQRLLDYGVMRLVYSPITRQYVLTAAGTGSLPSENKLLYRPGPQRGLTTIRVRSQPIVHEGRLAATAVYDNGAGVVTNLSGGNGYFDGFASEGSAIVRSRLKECAFRLWKVSDATKELLPHRALSVIGGPTRVGYSGARLIRNDLYTQMEETELQSAMHEVDHLSLDEGGTLLYRESPFLVSSGGSLQTSATLLTAYHALDANGKRERREATRTVGAVGGERAIDLPWIRPVESAETDIDTDQWTAVLGEVADSLQAKFNKQPRTFISPGLPVVPISGRIGAAEWAMRLWPRPTVSTKFAVDFDPRQSRVF